MVTVEISGMHSENGIMYWCIYTEIIHVGVIKFGWGVGGGRIPLYDLYLRLLYISI